MDQRIIDRDRLRHGRSPVLDDGQRTVIRLDRSVLMVIDPKFIDAHIKITPRDVIGLAFQTHTEFLKPV